MDAIAKHRALHMLSNGVYVMTARQDQQLGYALDSRWYGIGEFSDFMRSEISKWAKVVAESGVRAQ